MHPKISDEELDELTEDAEANEEDGIRTSVKPRQLLSMINELRELRRTSYREMQAHFGDIECRFNRSGFGTNGQANTLWAMCYAACDEVDQLRLELESLRTGQSRKA